MPIPAITLRMAAAALLLVLYAALCLGIWLRQRRQHARAQREAAELACAREGVQPLLVAWASQTGQAQELAHTTARLLHAAGEPVHLCPLNAVDAPLLANTRRALFIVSTYGEGDPPDNAALFQSRLMGGDGGGNNSVEGGQAGVPQQLHHLHYGLLALGDKQYTHYCGFGRALDAWLQAHGATAWFERIDMDNLAPAALAEWQHHLAQVSSLSEVDATAGNVWHTESTFTPWTLTRRQHMNPGSAGGAVFHLELVPTQADLAWESGDLVQVRVPAAPEHPREYSIASIAADGAIHLLVRLAQREDGTPGLASGWLTQEMSPGSAVELRLRAHSNFRLEDNAARPLVLIGNGTGLAGLRSHLRARAAAKAGPNWLLFGERNASHDTLYGDELQAWLASGVLQRLDLAFSRDQAERIYVQDVIAQTADTLRQWVQQGAAIYVCGSLQGMAQGVDNALHTALGSAQVEQLIHSGRYRRDVY